MPRVDVSDFVTEHACQLRLVAEKWQDPARDVDETARQREGIDRRLVDDREGPGQVRPVGGPNELTPDSGHVALEGRVVVDAHLLPHLGVVLPPHLNLFLFGHENQLAAPGGRIGRAAPDSKGQQRTHHRRLRHEGDSIRVCRSAPASRTTFSGTAPEPISPTRRILPASGPSPAPISMS